MANETILVVDADTKSQKVLEVSFKKAGYRVVITDSIEEAKGLIDEAQPDLIISDTALPDGDGFEFCAQLKQDDELGKIPFVFLTEERSLPQKMKGFELGADEYLTKPIYIKEVTSRVDVLLQKQAQRALSGGDVESFEGNLSDITMIDLLQTIEQELRTGTIRIERNHRDGFVYFREGNILDATCGKLQGEEALYRLMLWPNGKFAVKYHDNVERADHIEKDSGDLLIEGIQRLERWNELVDDVPELGRVFEADYHSLPDLLDRLPEEAGRVVRLFDGMRNLRDVIDDSPFDDVTTLQIVSRLFQEDVLTETEQEETESIRTTANLQAWLDGPKNDGGEGMPFSHVDGGDDDKDPLSDTSPGVADAFNYEDEDSEAFEEQTRPAQDSHPPLESPEESRQKSRKKTSAGLGPVSRESEPGQWKVHWDEEKQAGDSPSSVEDIEEMEKRRREEEARQIIRQSGQFNATKPQVMAVSRGDGQVDETNETADADLDEAERRRREAEARQLQEQSSDGELADDESTPTVSTENETQRDSLRESTQELIAEKPPEAERGRQREPTPIAGPGAGGHGASTPAVDQTSPGISVQDIGDEPSETAPADQTSPGIQIANTEAIPDAMTDEPSVDFEDEEQVAAGEEQPEDVEEEHDVDEVRSSSEMRAASVEEADAVSREAGESMRRSAPFAAVSEEEAEADAEAREDAAEEPGRRERRVTQEVSTSAVEAQAESSEAEDEAPAAEVEELEQGEVAEEVEAEPSDEQAQDEHETGDEGTIEPFVARGEDERLGAEPTPTYDESSDEDVAADEEEAGALFEMAEAVDEEQEDEEPEDIDASAVEELGSEAEIAVERSAKDRELVTAEYDLSKSKTDDAEAGGGLENEVEEGEGPEEAQEAVSDVAEEGEVEAESESEEAAADEEKTEEQDDEEQEAEDAAEDADEESAVEEDEAEDKPEAAAADEEEGAEQDDEEDEAEQDDQEEEAEQDGEKEEAEQDGEEKAAADEEDVEDDSDAAAASDEMSDEEIALSDHSHEASFFDEGEEGAFDYEFEDVPETSGRWKHFVTVAVVFGLVAVVLVVYSNMGDSGSDSTGGEDSAVTEEKADEKTEEAPEETVELKPEPKPEPEEEFDPETLGVDVAAAPDVATASASSVEQAATRQAEMFAMAADPGADAGQASADAGTSGEADAGAEPTQVAANTTTEGTDETQTDPAETTETTPDPEPKPEPKASASVDQAKTLLRRGKTRQALDMLEELSSAKPNSGEVAFYRGKAAYQMGRNGDAIEQFNRAINLGYTRASVYSELGSAYMVQGKRGEAKKAYQKYLELQPEGKTADEIRSVIKNL